MGNSCGGKAKTTAVPGSQYNIEGTTGNPD